jgi:uncharacterized protein YjiS (DUF1127 family)
MSRFRRAAAGVAERFLTARYQQALSGLNDRQLADIGLTRAGIAQRARELARTR